MDYLMALYSPHIAQRFGKLYKVNGCAAYIFLCVVVGGALLVEHIQPRWKETFYRFYEETRV